MGTACTDTGSTMTDEDQSFRLKILRCPSASEQLVAPGVHDKFLQKVKVSENISDRMIRRPQSVHRIKGTNLFILNILTVMILQKWEVGVNNSTWIIRGKLI
jgi:hypothetical protein